MRQIRLGGRRDKRLILVVEDSAINRAMLQAMLESNFDIVQAANGFEGLDQLAEHYDELSLILLDVYMPECNGFEFLRRKNQDERFEPVPVIVTTGSGAIEDEIKCLELGANDFIVKPYNYEIMMNRINNMIRLRESASILNLLTWDRLTGLYTKDYFFRTVDDVFATDDESYDIVCCDIEGFKVLVDRHGQEACDELLHTLATTLTATLPELAAGGRLDADTLAFLVSHRTADWESLLNGAAKQLPLDNVVVKFGILENAEQVGSASRGCNRAISALETVRDQHDMNVALFDDEVHQRQLLEHSIRESMQSALDRLQFEVYYQPKVDVRTGKACGAEALARWSHPEIGFISPGLFVPIFERNGFITKLDMFIWEEACKELARCREMGLPVVPFSVNASRIDFNLPDLAQRITHIADKFDVEYPLLHVELTETAYSERPEEVSRVLAELKGAGMSMELDDFGAGYSSLVSLNTLPLDVVKLDMSMIRQAVELDDYRILESTIQLAQSLGLKTVVEGVETADVAQRVTDMGCDMIQGYFYSRPLKRIEFEEYLATQ